MVKRFLQKKGLNFDKIFLPVVKMASIRIILGFVANLNLELKQVDVETTFLHGVLHEEIYMEQLEGFEVMDKQLLRLVKIHTKENPANLLTKIVHSGKTGAVQRHSCWN